MPQNKKTKNKNAADSSTANQKPNSPTAKPGFKLTKLGWIPVEWEVVRLGESVEFLDNRRKPIKSEDRKNMQGVYPYYGASGIIDYVNDWIFDETVILLGEDGANILSRSTPLAFVVSGKVWINNHAHVLKPKSDINIGFLTEYLERIDYTPYNTGTAQPKLNKEVVKTIRIAKPPRKEQTRIATCLTTWDRAITTTRNLLQQLDERKKGLMQGLLSGAVRVPGFEDEWEEFKIGKFVKESKLPGTNGLEAKKLTVKLWGRGVKRKIDKQPGSTNTNYFTRKSGQLIYSKLDFLNCAFGLIPDELDGLESTLDLPTFDISDKIDPIFLLERIKQKSFYKRFGERANGSRIARRINPDLFRSFPINLPSLPEQRAIAKVLTTADQEIALYKRKLAKLEAQKKGLMQQLLTGQKRLSA
jgi:type I restriction enzyme S subunit